VGRFLALGALGLASGCGAGAVAPPTSVLLITLDTTRADVLSCRGESASLFPTICGLSAEGVRFPIAYTVAPLTLPAHASILSGLYPPRHGVRDNGLQALPSSAETIAEYAGRSGRRTAAFVSTAILDRAYGLDQGFEVYDQPLLAAREQDNFYLERDAFTTAKRFVAWLSEIESERGFFAWLHFYDPHLPYAPPEDVQEQTGGNAYLGEIALVDRALRDVFSALDACGRNATTWVVLTADHGEALGEHGEPTHGALCYEATMRVPLLFRPPPGTTKTPGSMKYASVVDIHPTILRLLGLTPPPGVDGFDLFRADPESQASDSTRGVYFESYSGYLYYGWSPLVGWVDGFGKYLHSSTPELYLRSDPAEERNVAVGRERETNHARERIADVLGRPQLETDRFEADGELQRALWTLGYAGGVATHEDFPSPLAGSDRPAPLERLHELDLLHRAEALYRTGRIAEALPLVASIVEENPKHLLALDLFALCSMHASRFGEAEEALRARLRYGPEKSDAHVNLALCLEARGELQGALTELERAAELNPHETVIADELSRIRALAQGKQVR